MIVIVLISWIFVTGGFCVIVLLFQQLLSAFGY